MSDDEREPLVYYDATTHTLVRPGLRNTLQPGYVATATVTVTLTDAVTGVEIAGQAWPLTLDYVAGSDGDYRATLSAALVVTVGQRLRARMVASAAGGVQRTWVNDMVVVQG